MQLSRRRLILGFLAGLFVLTAAIWSAVYSGTPAATGVLTFAMLDIGQGDSLYIESPTGAQVVIDGGPNNAVLTQLPSVMPLLDRSIDAVIETHPDADHIGGLVDVLRRYEVGVFIEPDITKHTATNDTLEGEVLNEHAQHYVARRGMWLDLGGGAHLDILYPDWDVTNMDLKQDNEGGIVARLVYGETSVLLMADTGFPVEEHLLQIASTSELKSTMLKVGHHGSRLSSEESFVAAVAPQVALISVGAHNTYGHPTPQTLSTLAALNIPVLRTDKEGTIVFKSDGKNFVRVR